MPGVKFKRWVGDGQAGYNFYCPGCRDVHGIKTEPTGWGFNNDVERPVVSPSILVKSVEHLTDEQHAIWMAGGELPTPIPTLCHSFVGQAPTPPGWIQFLGDCTHALRNQTVELPDWDSRHG